VTSLYIGISEYFSFMLHYRMFSLVN